MRSQETRATRALPIAVTGVECICIETAVAMDAMCATWAEGIECQLPLAVNGWKRRELPSTCGRSRPIIGLRAESTISEAAKAAAVLSAPLAKDTLCGRATGM